MTELNRQQICAALGVSESTSCRLEQIGLPYTPVGVRSKRYDLDECKAWLKANEGLVTGKAARVQIVVSPDVASAAGISASD
jgi:hypothetical protein